MERIKRVFRDRRALTGQAYERWKAYQPEKLRVRGGEAVANWMPRPQAAPVTPDQHVRFESRERLRGEFDNAAHRDLRIAKERQIGATLDFAELPPSEQALKAGRPVVRIVTLPADGMVPQGFATGFLIAPNLILTNHHVFRAADEARGCGVQFLFEHTSSGLREGLIFEALPDRYSYCGAHLTIY